MSSSPVLATAAPLPVATAWCEMAPRGLHLADAGDESGEKHLLDQRALMADHRTQHLDLAGTSDEASNFRLDDRAGSPREHVSVRCA